MDALRRRRAAAVRLPPLRDGHRDPHRVRPRELTAREVDGWTAAVAHLDQLGHDVVSTLPPAVRAALVPAAEIER